MIKSPASDTTIFFLGSSGTSWITSDCGQHLNPIDTDSRIIEVKFHPFKKVNFSSSSFSPSPPSFFHSPPPTSDSCISFFFLILFLLLLLILLSLLFFLLPLPSSFLFLLPPLKFSLSQNLIRNLFYILLGAKNAPKKHIAKSCTFPQTRVKTGSKKLSSYSTSRGESKTQNKNSFQNPESYSLNIVQVILKTPLLLILHININ